MKINIFKKAALSAEEKKRRNKDRLILILSGALMGFSFPPFPFPFLMFAGLIPYFFVIERKEKLIDINRATYLMAFVFTLTSVYWVGAWQVGRDPFLMIAGGLLMFINPIFFLIPSTLLYFARKIFKPALALFFFPLFWITYEYFYMITDASFPWLTLGNGLAYFNTFIQIADIIGAVGLSLIVVLLNVFLYKCILLFKTEKRNSYLFGAAAFVVFIVPVIYGAYRINTIKISTKTVKAGLIQPDLDPYEKWAGGSIDDMADDYFALSQQALNKGAELLVWPETAFPVYLFGGHHPGTAGKLYHFLQSNNVSLLTGMPDIIYYPPNAKIPADAKDNEIDGFHYATYNAAMLVDPHTFDLQRYGKMKLVPFGERVPFVTALPFLGSMLKWGVGLSGWNVGQDTSVFNVNIYNTTPKNNASFFAQPGSPVVKQKIKINGIICYESIYPYLIAEFTKKGSELITVVTNDSWYGNSSGPYQHKEISALRAVENRRSVIRAANGGISCYINPLGKTETATQMYTKGFLVCDVALQSGLTFFVQHSLLIPVGASVFSLWVVGLYILLALKRKFYK